GIATVIERARIFRDELDRLGVVLDRLVELVLVVPEDATVVVGDREIVALPAAGRDLSGAGGDAFIKLRIAAVEELLILLERCPRWSPGTRRRRRQRLSRRAERH